MRLSKTYKGFVKLAEKEGWKVKQKTRGVMLTSPEGATITIHGTETDHRAEKNTRARLKAAGLDV